MSSDAAATRQQFPTGRVLILGGEPVQRLELAQVVRGLGYHPGGDADGSDGAAEIGTWTEIDAVVLLADEHDTRWVAQAQKIQRETTAPPIVVLGPPSAREWRQRALKAGAFLCASVNAPAEDLQWLLSGAIHYRALVKENNFLRVECERICMGLLTSYGEVASSLKDSTEEVEALQQNLRDIRDRIIRAFV